MINTTEQHSPPTHSRPLTVGGITLLAHIIPAVMLVLALWLPYGFTLTGLIEEWGLLGAFTTHGLFYIADTTSPLAPHALRPLTILPQAIAYYLDPYSFKYWNLLLALSLCVKGSSISYIITHITGSLKWGMIAALLIIIYPADTMQLSFRALHINWALSFILLGTAIFLAALQTKSKIASYILNIGSAILLFAACAMYEASLLLSVLPCLMLLVKSGTKSIFVQLRQQPWKHATWFAGAFTYIAYVIHTAPLIKSYQSTIAGNGIIASITHSLPNLFSIGLLRTTLGGWYDASRITRIEFSTHWYSTCVILAIFFFVFLLLLEVKKRKTLEPPIKISIAATLFITGLLLVLLGYAPFLLSASHQSISQRTFLFASPGGVFVTLAALLAIDKGSKNLAVACVAFLIFIGFSTQLYQFHHYAKLSDRQRNIVKNIVERYDGEINNKTLVIIDKTNQLNATWMFINENLQATLNYLYGHPFTKMEMCHERNNEWQHFDGVGRRGTCEENANEWIFHYPTPISGPGIELGANIEDKRIAKSETVLITVNPDEVVTANPAQLERLRNAHTRTALIYRGFVDKPDYHNSLVSFTDKKPNDHYFWGFGNWWSMELPITGSGWREAEWGVGKFQHNASAWKTNKKSSLDFKFKPDSELYHLNGVFFSVSPAIKSSMKIEINSINIPFQWKNDITFEAELAQNQLKDGMNTISFISDVDDKFYGFAGRLDWFEIKK
jgi:hypothetical protein